MHNIPCLTGGRVDLGQEQKLFVEDGTDIFNGIESLAAGRPGSVNALYRHDYFAAAGGLFGTLPD